MTAMAKSLQLHNAGLLGNAGHTSPGEPGPALELGNGTGLPVGRKGTGPSSSNS